MASAKHPNPHQLQVLAEMLRLAGGHVRNEHGRWCFTDTNGGPQRIGAGVVDQHNAIVAPTSMLSAFVKHGYLGLVRETRGTEMPSFPRPNGKLGEPLYWCGHYRIGKPVLAILVRVSHTAIGGE